MNAAGFQQTGNGSGNGEQRKPNNVKLWPIYKRGRIELEAAHPRLKTERFFDRLEVFMVIADPADAYPIGDGPTTEFFFLTPENFDPRLVIYFSYSAHQVIIRAVTTYA